MSKKRENTFDVLRVIAMIMVIIIHVSNVYGRNFDEISNSSYLISLIFNTVSRVSVPIFFMISGALLLDKDFDKEKYKKRLKKYLILIIGWDIIYLAWEYLYFGKTYNQLYKIIVDPFRAHLWFLYTILVIYAFQPLMKNIFSKLSNNMKLIVLVIWFTVSTLCLVIPSIVPFFSIFSSIGYFVLGKYIYEYAKKENFKNIIAYFFIATLLCFSVSIFLNYTYSIKYEEYYNLFFAYRTPFIIIPAVILFAIVVSLSNKIKPNKMVSFLSDVSLGVYLIHGIFLDITIKTNFNEKISSIIGIPIYTIIIFILSVLSVYLLRKMKFVKKYLM